MLTSLAEAMWYYIANNIYMYFDIINIGLMFSV